MNHDAVCRGCHDHADIVTFGLLQLFIFVNSNLFVLESAGVDLVEPVVFVGGGRRRGGRGGGGRGAPRGAATVHGAPTATDSRPTDRQRTE